MHNSLEGNALRERMMENIEDAAPRLIYSDFLEEHDDERTARLLRHPSVPSIIQVMLDSPYLNSEGWRYLFKNSMSLETRAQVFTNARFRLITSGPEFDIAKLWLTAQIKIEEPQYNSYSLKHELEKHLSLYCSNGCLIAAAIYLGVTYKPLSNQNVLLGISRSLIVPDLPIEPQSNLSEKMIESQV